ncbi:MAG: four-helix bundle copper-binding protein [Gemmatimonadota bacterium]|nr:four-helix bundle copper-binding protein [Gemmatimonadota bacterium]
MPTIDIDRYFTPRQEVYHACIEACVECLIACEVCGDACLDEEMDMSECVRHDRTCADACTTALRVMARGGPLAAEVCTACAEACDACAQECEKHGAHHDHCRRCAEACRKCAAECRRMNVA